MYSPYNKLLSAKFPGVNLGDNSGVSIFLIMKYYTAGFFDHLLPFPQKYKIVFMPGRLPGFL